MISKRWKTKMLSKEDLMKEWTRVLSINSQEEDKEKIMLNEVVIDVKAVFIDVQTINLYNFNISSRSQRECIW